MKTLLTALVLLANSACANSLPPRTPPARGGSSSRKASRTSPRVTVCGTGRLKGGNYIVRCNSIIALSKHEYISDGVARVVEVNLTLNSAQMVRFYFLEPYKPEPAAAR
jgi:hypothetical protein